MRQGQVLKKRSAPWPPLASALLLDTPNALELELVGTAGCLPPREVSGQEELSVPGAARGHCLPGRCGREVPAPGQPRPRLGPQAHWPVALPPAKCHPCLYQTSSFPDLAPAHVPSCPLLSFRWSAGDATVTSSFPELASPRGAVTPCCLGKVTGRPRAGQGLRIGGGPARNAASARASGAPVLGTGPPLGSSPPPRGVLLQTTLRDCHVSSLTRTA